MTIIRIYVDGDTEQPTPAQQAEPPVDLQEEIDRINRALCDVLTRIAKIEGNVQGLRMRLIDQDAEVQVP